MEVADDRVELPRGDGPYPAVRVNEVHERPAGPLFDQLDFETLAEPRIPRVVDLRRCADMGRMDR